MKEPAKPEQLQMRAKRLVSLAKLGAPVQVLRLDCELILQSYYGSWIRAGVALIKHGIHTHVRDFCNWCIIQFCDLVGWTKWYDHPQTETTIAYKSRHGHKCQYMNCDDVDCIGKSVPSWFKWLTRWDKP